MDILYLMITSLGILIALSLIFVQIVPERKRRRLELLYDKYLDLEFRCIDTLMLDEKINKSEVEGKIESEKKFILNLYKIVDEQHLKIVLCSRRISLNTINIALFAYLIIIFSASILYAGLVSLSKLPIQDVLILIFVILTIFGFLMLIPVSYLSLHKDYSIKLKESSEEKQN